MGKYGPVPFIFVAVALTGVAVVLSARASGIETAMVLMPMLDVTEDPRREMLRALTRL